ncbi:MAG: hypothetical protein AAF170_02220 [Bacteroidota bacterium]
MSDDSRPDPTSSTSSEGGNPGYALGQLAKALTTAQDHPDADTRERADRRAGDWLRVFGGMLSGALRIGDRRPVKGTPVWATPKVLDGGFATGDLLAGGSLLSHEKALLDTLPQMDRPLGRASLNAYFLTEDGLAILLRQLETGAYRITVPEEGALLTVAWLANNGRAAEARRILDAIGPWFPRLRFYPMPAEATPPDGEVLVRIHDVGNVSRQLENLTTPRDIAAQTEAYTVWLPHQDDVVALLMETVEGPMPHVVSQTPYTTEVNGGWPFQTFPTGWRDRARACLKNYARLRKAHPLCGKPDRPSGNPVRLRHALAVAAKDPANLTGYEVAAVRTALAQIRSKRGLPGSDVLATLRAEQANVAALPTKTDWAALLKHRLSGHGPAMGLAEDEIDDLLAPATSAEAERYDLPEDTPIPDAFRPRLLRATDATPEQHIAWGTLSSAESLARVVPFLSARVRATGLDDPALRQLDEALYVAFRRRRSVLLLYLQSQARLDEIPWVAAIERLRTKDTSAAGREALTRTVGLALTTFPEQVLPNKLLQEIRALARSTGLDIPFVDEIAADIFMGTFTTKYLGAAQIAARQLEDSVYARYYHIDTDAVLAIDDATSSTHGPATSQAFDRMCHDRAGVRRTPGVRWLSPAQNGAVIEQEQVLTTHNLATLFDALGLADRLDLNALAKQTYTFVADAIESLRGPRWGQLRAVKNAAYAWRQLVYFLSMASETQRDLFFEWARSDIKNRSADFEARVDPILEDLEVVAGDELRPRPGEPFYGWVLGDRSPIHERLMGARASSS